jgi:crotonobetainyl-CoA:carnitine CoA-transferase CaiB-like acyl-CoA transferase
MQALEGLQVVSLSTTLVGAHVGQVFADFGADVIEIEPPGGSPLRGQPAWPFWARGKRSIVLDLGDDADRAAARDLAGGADVVIETWRPGVAERHGLGYDDLSALNPALVYGSVTGFGRTGRLAGIRGYEGIVAAKIGTFGSVRLTAREGPSFVATPACSFSAAQTLLQGLFAALYERETSGLGQRVDTTLLQAFTAHDCWNWLVRLMAQRYSDAFTAVPRVDTNRRVPNGYLSFRLLVALSKDGRWMQFSQTSERLWLDFLEVLELQSFATDPYWSDVFEADQVDKRDEYWTLMLNKVRERTIDEWNDVFDEYPNVFAEVFREGNELLWHPQMIHDEQVVEVEDPKLGKVREPGALVKMHGTPATVDRRAPHLDEHGAELRAAPRRTTQRGGEPAGDTGAPPLAGVTVIELGTYYAGPYGATLLADLGARVIKIEEAAGDPMRWIMPFPESGGVKVLSGKESVVVDFHDPEGRDIVYDLVRRADIVLRTFRGGVAERLGLDDATLMAINPNLMYHNAPGFGVDGPYAHRPAYAPTIGAGGGQAGRNLGPNLVQRADLTLDEVKDLALRVSGGAMSGSNPDSLSSLGVATGMLLGLLAHKRGAPAQSMLTTMMNTMAHTLSEDMIAYEGRADAPAVDIDVLGFGPLYRLYETAEGWVFLAALTERERNALFEVMSAHGVGDPGSDDDLARALGAAFAQRSAHDWEKDLTAVDVACVVVEDGPSEARIMEGDDALGKVLDMVTEQTHPVVGDYLRMKPLSTLSRTPGVAPGAPLLGADTEAVLRELGRTDEQIAALRERGVIPAA